MKHNKTKFTFKTENASDIEFLHPRSCAREDFDSIFAAFMALPEGKVLIVEPVLDDTGTLPAPLYAQGGVLRAAINTRARKTVVSVRMTKDKRIALIRRDK